MMKLLPVLALILLAGCSEAPPASVAVPLQTEHAPPDEERGTERDGSLTGVGASRPAGSYRLYGEITTPESFTVSENATNLTVTMTWDHAVSQPFFLHLLNGETNYRVQSSPPFDGRVGVTYYTNDPLPGTWDAI